MIKHNIKKIIKEEIDKILSLLHEEYLDEGGYAKLVRSLAGMEPNIESIGIITAENPDAQELSPKENKERNRKLAEDLRILGYGYYQVAGKYGNVEKPFVVPNIDREDLISLGQMYGQDAVIYVEKTPRGSIAELIGTSTNDYGQRAQVILPLAKDVEDFYTMYKGRKFVIPFFDDMFADKALVKGKIVDVK